MIVFCLIIAESIFIDRWMTSKPPTYNAALDCSKEDSRIFTLARVAAREIVALREECATLRVQLDNSHRALNALKSKIFEFSNSVTAS